MLKINKDMKYSRELKVGILAILCVVILYFGLNFLKGINIFSSSSTYVAQYENVKGLTAQAPVYIKGHQVGLVESIQYDFSKTPAFTVTVSIDKSIQLPTGTEMALIADGLLGGMAIELILPTGIASTYYQKGDTLKPVVIPTLFENLENGALAKLDSVLSETTILVAAINAEITQGSVHQTLQNVEAISSDLVVSGNDLRNLTHNQLPLVMKKVDSTISSIQNVASDVENVDIASVMGVVDSLNNVISDVNQAINSQDGTLGLLLNDKALYNNLNTALKDLDDVVLNVDSVVMSIKARPFIQKKLPK
jgi:phospholipid/cholesterol/gamma-HCH transport system substrate-binding protein